MSKLASTTRQHKIIEKLRSAKQASFEEINDYLQYQSEIVDEDLCISQRTFQRDIREIESLYGIYIAYNRSENCYYIEEEYEQESYNRLVDAFNVATVLKIHDQHQPFIHYEKHQEQGSQYLTDLLYAIKNQMYVSFLYRTQYEEPASKRTVAPLALREFRKRWYVIAHNAADEKIKTYALDRMQNIDVLKKKFQNNFDFNIENMMKHSFGIITPNNKNPETVVLSFTPQQGRYIKALPLHETQEILTDNNHELRIRLNIYLEHDFKMEILSLGDTVTVIEPTHFAGEIRDMYANALKKYTITK
ncbi:MAG: WYL domain-containing protein [Bacteroidales bacterium]|jgi:predicted DNA-binding transcriptional regulator YafY|nr:WYL domain-containing protein [Bacteroidales bacterium]